MEIPPIIFLEISKVLWSFVAKTAPTSHLVSNGWLLKLVIEIVYFLSIFVKVFWDDITSTHWTVIINQLYKIKLFVAFCAYTNVFTFRLTIVS